MPATPGETRIGFVGLGIMGAPMATNLLEVEALMLAAASNLDVQEILEAISGGAAGSWHLSNLGRRILKGDFEAGSTVKLQQKNLKLALQAANDVKVALPAAGMVHQLFNIVERLGCGDDGTQALMKAYEVQADRRART